jgi:hypothetical protein
MLSDIKDLDSPDFWKLVNISRSPDGFYTNQGFRLIRELERSYIMIECYPAAEAGQWRFEGWVLEGATQIYDYKEVELVCEVTSVSEPPILVSNYLISMSDTDNFAFTVSPSITHGSLDNAYRFSSMLESHSRATYLKFLTCSLVREHPKFEIERVRQGFKSIEVFGKIEAGEWSISLLEDIYNNLYDVVFTIWKKGVPSKEVKNNPSITSQEKKYYSSASRVVDPIRHLVEVLEEAVNLY